MKFFEKHKKIILIIIFAFTLRFLLSFFGTLRLDQGTFIAWSNILTKNVLRNFYNSWSDYLPGYLYILWILGKINILGILPQEVLYKLPAILSDLVTGFLIFKILEKSKGEKWGLVGAAIYLFNPAVLANSALWGQVDSITALTSVLTIYLMDVNYFASAVILSIGTLVKPQTAFILPVILYQMVKDKWKLPKFFLYSLTSFAVFVFGFIPFWNGGTLPGFIFSRLGVSLNQYPYTSVNAFNFWGLTGFWKPDNIYFQIAGYLAVLVAVILLFSKIAKSKNASYYLLTFIFAGSFVFFTRMHERHLLPVFAPLTIIAVENPLMLIPLLGFSLIYIANLYYSFEWVSNNFLQVYSDATLKFFSLVNVVLSGLVFYWIYKNIKISWSYVKKLKNDFLGSFRFQKKKEIILPKVKISSGKMKFILPAILVFAFVTRVFNLSSPSTMYFDEVYHAFTAKVIMSPDAAKAWEWWNTPPPGFAYEWTHPPVAKLGMVLGMTIFGQNSFGWRILGALLGVGSVLLVYLLGRQIFEDEVIGLLSAGMFSLDGLALVMSRIGMNDSYILFFALLSIYLFMKKKDFWSAFTFGLAIASKWSAVWAIPILGILWLWRKKKFTKSILWFFVIPIAVYLASYADMFLTGHTLSVWWGMQEQMWWYHTGLKATHPYSSLWWSWPFLIRPIYLYTSEEIGGMVARIYAMGNPLVFWFGLISVAVSAAIAFAERNKKLGLVVFSYLVMFVPWAISPRIMFLYHYLPAIPFMTIATGYVLRRSPKLIIPVFLFTFLLFVYFYPHWAGLSIPLWLDKSYYWISSWR